MGLGGGLIHEAKYINNTNQTIDWGYTTDDEMMLVFIHFTTEPLTTNLENITKEEAKFKVFPNPFQGATNITYTLNEKADVQLEVFNFLGQQVDLMVNEQQTAGDYQFSFSAKNDQLNDGMYIVKLTIDGKQFSQKIVKE